MAPAQPDKSSNPGVIWGGGATMVRVHDVAATRQFLDVLKAVAEA